MPDPIAIDRRGFLGLAGTAATGLVTSSAETTVTADGRGSLQDTIDDAPPGSRVDLGREAYDVTGDAPIRIDKPLWLTGPVAARHTKRGEGAYLTVTDESDVISIESGNVAVTNIGLKGPSRDLADDSGHGIVVPNDQENHLILRGLAIEGFPGGSCLEFPRNLENCYVGNVQGRDAGHFIRCGSDRAHNLRHTTFEDLRAIVNLTYGIEMQRGGFINCRFEDVLLNDLQRTGFKMNQAPPKRTTFEQITVSDAGQENHGDRQSFWCKPSSRGHDNVFRLISSNDNHNAKRTMVFHNLAGSEFDRLDCEFGHIEFSDLKEPDIGRFDAPDGTYNRYAVVDPTLNAAGRHPNLETNGKGRVTVDLFGEYTAMPDVRVVLEADYRWHVADTKTSERDTISEVTIQLTENDGQPAEAGVAAHVYE